MKLFGQYLLEKDRITRLDIIRARDLQIKNNKSFSDMGLEKGYLRKEDIEKINTLMEENNKPFEDIALNEGIITPAIRDDILDEMDRIHIYFGEALIMNGALAREDLIAELKEFNLLRIKEQRIREEKKREKR